MISYQTYKLITESSFALGIKSKPSIGIGGSRLQEMGFERDDNPEMLDGGMEDFPPEEPGEEMGTDDLNGDAEAGMEGESQPCPACNHDGEKDEEACANDENCQACEACGGMGWLPPDDMGGEEMGDEMGSELDGGEEMGDEMGGEMGGEMPSPDPMAQKQPMFSKKFMCKTGGCNSMQKKYMHKEESVCDDDFFSSLTNQVKGNINDKNKSGIAEDILIAMDGHNEDPTPGEVGFAPQGRLNQIGNGFSMDDFKELPTLGQ